MPESTWEILGKPTMIPSFGRIGFFKGKMITRDDFKDGNLF